MKIAIKDATDNDLRSAVLFASIFGKPGRRISSIHKTWITSQEELTPDQRIELRMYVLENGFTHFQR